jgi:arsenate reductase
MSDKVYNVLFVCTGNSARSIMAEALMNHLAGGRFRAWSAGSQPKGVVNPFARQTLETWHIPSDGLRSKSWDEFAQPEAPTLDFVITVCDNAAGEVCPVWPGQPMTAHWGAPDPAAHEGSDEDKAMAFMAVGITLKRRIELMLALPMSSLAPLALQSQMDRIGHHQANEPTLNVLILCTHNSARSVLAEGMLNHWAARLGRPVRAHSAGSAPGGRVNPFALEALSGVGIATAGFRSKSWDEFTGADAPPLSVVITVCDSAAAEACPVFFGGATQPIKTHWGYPDPSNADGGDDGKRRAFELTRQAVGYRMLQLLELLHSPAWTGGAADPAARAERQRALDLIGRS